MRVLDAGIHAFLDVAFVLAFALGPLVFGLGGSPAVISFVLAIGFLILALLAFARRATAVISIPHGLVELAITIFLAFLPRLDGYSPGSPARRFFWIMAVAVGVVWLLTAYGERTRDSRAATVARVPGEPASGGSTR